MWSRNRWLSLLLGFCVGFSGDLYGGSLVLTEEEARELEEVLRQAQTAMEESQERIGNLERALERWKRMYEEQRSQVATLLQELREHSESLKRQSIELQYLKRENLTLKILLSVLGVGMGVLMVRGTR